MIKRLRAWIADESAATAIEYSLIAGLIALVIITAVSLLSADIQTMFTTVADSL